MTCFRLSRSMRAAKWHRVASLPLLAALLGPAHAQTPAPAPMPPQASAAAPVTAPTDPLHWAPQGLSALAQNASFHTDFTLDRSMLALATGLSTLDEPTRQAVARLNGVSVHMYHFPAPDRYSGAELDVVRAQYDALGWKHISMNQGAQGTAATPGGPVQGLPRGHTDLWLNMQGVNVSGVVVLLAGPTEVNLVAVSGNISTLDLLRLRGHFGIPNFSGGGLPSTN